MKLPSHNKLNTYIPLSSHKALMIPTLTAKKIKKSNFSLREQKAQTEIHKIHKTHYQSTNSITKHRSNQKFIQLQNPQLIKSSKLPKKSRRQSNQRKEMLKRKRTKQKANHFNLPLYVLGSMCKSRLYDTSCFLLQFFCLISAC